MKKICLFLICLCTKVMLAQSVNRYDVVITEIFPDPTPSAGLPNSEYLELTNVSGQSINLDKWKITDGNSTAIIKESFVLQPDSLVIICPRAFTALFDLYGTTIGVSAFPSLDNTGDLIILLSPEGKTIHAVSYKPSWYKNTLKQDGGWSLEMIDNRMPCREDDNWQASVSNTGGTPGQTNSIRTYNPDKEAPGLIRTYAIDSVTIAAVFNESLDSLFSAIPERYEIDEGIGKPLSVATKAPEFREVILRLARPLLPARVYRLQVNEATDCAGNIKALRQEVKTGIPQPPREGQLRINEILFDPRPGGVDYVEIFNRGPMTLDLQEIYLGNKQNGLTGSVKKCSETAFLIYPGDYLVLTENAGIVFREYTVKNKEYIISLAAMPSFPDDQGTIVLMDRQGKELDIFSYRDDYHFPLLSNRQGVSLERTDPAAPSMDPANWHSAATDAGYGTPGYINSQFMKTDPVAGEININPLTFSPDQDGHDDQLTIQYKFPAPGYTCSVIIFDHAGRPVRYLVRNNLCGTNGYFRWNGLDEKTQNLPAGIYYVVAEIFNLEGKRKIIKRGVVLAYKLS